MPDPDVDEVDAQSRTARAPGPDPRFDVAPGWDDDVADAGNDDTPGAYDAPGLYDPPGADDFPGFYDHPPIPDLRPGPDLRPAAAPPSGQSGPSSPRSARRTPRLPAVFRLAVVDPALRGALALAVVALVGAAGAVWFAWEHRPGTPAEAARPTVTTQTGVVSAGAVPPVEPAASPSPPAAATGASAEQGPGSVLVVDVAGLVVSPGVVTLSPGARVVDAVELAGGVLPGTDTTGLSLARPLVDGEQIFVDGSPGPADPVVAGQPAGAGSPAVGGAGVGGAGGGAPPLVNLNTATVAELDALPGVGPVLAQRIVDWRAANGGFTSTDQLGEVSGLGDKRLAELLPLVTV